MLPSPTSGAERAIKSSIFRRMLSSIIVLDLCANPIIVAVATASGQGDHCRGVAAIPLMLGVRALLHCRARGTICPSRFAVSSSVSEQLVHKTHFSSRPRFEHEAMAFADHAHTSKPLIVADAAGSDLNPRVGLISRFNAWLPHAASPVARPRPFTPPNP